MAGITLFGSKPKTTPTPVKGIPLAVLEMDPKKAADEYQAYADRIAAEQKKAGKALVAVKNVSPNTYDAVDQKLAEVYLALSQGAKIVNMEDTFIAVGCDNKNRPKIALAKADWRTVVMERHRDGSFKFAVGTTYEPRYATEYLSGATIDFPIGTLRTYDPNLANKFFARATVPVIPAGLRPDQLSDFHILWEPLWIGEAPRIADPILLRHIGGVLYKVIVAWDVSPIEQAILRGL